MSVSLAQAIAAFTAEGMKLTSAQVALVNSAQEKESRAAIEEVLTRKLIDATPAQVAAWTDDLIGLASRMKEVTGDKSGGGSDKFARKETFKRGFTVETSYGSLKVWLTSDLV